jgi:hypothetical protein
MSIDISPEIETRLTTRAHAEGMSVETFLLRLIDEREELAEIIERAYADDPPRSIEEIRAKIARGFVQSEDGEVVDGDTFTSELLGEMDEMERSRRVG